MAERNTSTVDRTTLAGGVLLIVAGVIGLLGALYFAIPLAQSSFLFSSAVPAAVGSIISLAAFVVLAIGTRDEDGITGRSSIGRVALVVFGGGYLIYILIALVPTAPGGAAVVVGGLVELVVTVAGLFAGVTAARAGKLRGVARWTLLGVGVLNAILSLGSFIPNTDLTLGLALWKVDVLIPLAIIALGATYAIYGRSAVIRSRLNAINAKW